MEKNAAKANEAGTNTKCKVVNEVPDTLKRLTLIVAKAFYGNVHYVVMNQLIKQACMKEDVLCAQLHFETKFLRNTLAQLKADKLVKERLVNEFTNSDTVSKSIYYFINYRGVLNVTKYKLDHIRQRLEERDKQRSNNLSYLCKGCGSHYTSLDINNIFDQTSGELRCWRCSGEVDIDDMGTQDPRTALARFNDQMKVIFSLLESLDNIQLAPQLLDPVAAIANRFIQEKMTKSKGGGGAQIHQNARVTYTYSVQHANEIIVSLQNGNNQSFCTENSKELPYWLKSSEEEQAEGGNDASRKSLLKKDAQAFWEPRTAEKGFGKELLYDTILRFEVEEELDGIMQPEASRSGNTNSSSEKEGPSERQESSDEESVVYVQGEARSLEDITQEDVLKMSQAEKEEYTRIAREHFNF